MVGGGGGGGGGGMWAWPRILSARIALYYGRTISNLLPTGLTCVHNVTTATLIYPADTWKLTSPNQAKHLA